MSVVYKYRSVDSPSGESVRETKVARVEFDEGNGYAGDFEGYYMGTGGFLEMTGKRWTVEEIIAECKEAIDQINKMEA